MDKELLFKPRLPEADVEVPGVGTVRVRALSRIEAMKVQEAGGVGATERRILAFGMVDPSLTEDEAKRWQDASPGSEIEVVTAKIAELSGVLDKEAYKSVRGGSEPGVRVLSGAEAVDDGDGAAPSDGP